MEVFPIMPHEAQSQHPKGRTGRRAFALRGKVGQLVAVGADPAIIEKAKREMRRAFAEEKVAAAQAELAELADAG